MTTVIETHGLTKTYGAVRALDGLDLSAEARDKLFGFEREGWRAEFESIGEYLDGYGPRMPQALKDEQQRIAATLA